MNNLKSEIYNEKNAQEFLNRDTFITIAFDSHFSFYPDIFSDDNLSSLNINDISENREVDVNEFPINFYQDRELIIDHSFGINEHVLHIHSCVDTLDEIERNCNECREFIYDSYFDIKDIDLFTSLLNPHDQSLMKCENEEHSNSEIVLNGSHFQTINHTHDFSI